MNIISIILTVLVAVLFFYIMYLETFVTDSDSTSRVFNISKEELERPSLNTLFKNQGVYNGLIGVGLLYGTFFSKNPKEVVGMLLVYIILVAIYGGLTSDKKIILKQGGLLLTHDIMLLNNYEETRKTLSDAINMNVSPLPKENWLLLFEETGFKTVNSLHDKLTLLTVSGLVDDEGILNTLKIIKNGFKRENRSQFIKMGVVFKKLEKDMNFICFVNKKVL